MRKDTKLFAYSVGDCVAVALTDFVASNGIGNGVPIALTNLVIAYGIGYIIAVAVANLVASNGISNGVAVAVTYFVAPNGIGYIVAVAVANAYIRGRATTTWGDFHRLAGAKAKQGEKYVTKLFHHKPTAVLIVDWADSSVEMTVGRSFMLITFMDLVVCDLVWTYTSHFALRLL